MDLGPFTPTISIVGFIAVVPVVFIGILALYQFIKTRRRFILVAAMAFFFYASYLFSTALSYLVESLLIFLIAHIALFIPMTYIFVFFVDSLSRESADPIKLVIVSIISTAYFISLMIPGSVSFFHSPEGELLLYLNDYTLIGVFCMYMSPSVMLLYYFAKILWNAPKSIRSYAVIALIGGIMGGILTTISITFGLDTLVPGLTFLLTGIGNLLIGIMFVVQPKLSYILPFRALRLAVVETQSGISIFTHDWSKSDDLVDDQLFSGMLQGIGSILNESLKRGNIQEILLEQATLILRRSEKFSIVCVLITTRSSRSLRHALSSFADRFFIEYSPYFSNPHKLDNFTTATKLVEDYFPFIPEYD